jgi:hypothetical protein
MFSYVSLESRVPAGHPLRGIKALLGEALASMSREFERVYAREGRPSIPPERLVRAAALQILYSIRSERLLCEQLVGARIFGMFVAFAGLTRVRGGGRFAKSLDTTSIQPLPALLGILNGPLNVAPACSTMVSPGFAVLGALQIAGERGTRSASNWPLVSPSCPGASCRQRRQR